MRRLTRKARCGCSALRSDAWLNHFHKNRKRRSKIDWEREPKLTLENHGRLIRSIQAWQLGETSDGAHLLKATRGFLARFRHSARDRERYFEAVKLFIKEEQKHGENLGRYLDQVGAKRIRFDLGDTGFRMVRYLFHHMEIWSVSVLMVETTAQIYYKALRDSGRCELLSEICADILVDEAHHLRFQIERIRFYYFGRGVIARRVAALLYRSFYAVIVGAVWVAHHRAFREGGLTFVKFWRVAWRKFLVHRRRIEEPGVVAEVF